MKKTAKIEAYFEAMKKESENGTRFPSGANKAFCAWGCRCNNEILFDGFLWDKEVHDFIGTMRKAGVETFVFTNKSTALMDNLHDFAAEGCSMEGLYTIKRKGGIWGEETIKGIRIRL